MNENIPDQGFLTIETFWNMGNLSKIFVISFFFFLSLYSRAAAQMSPSLIRHISSSGATGTTDEACNTEGTSFVVAPCSCNSIVPNVAQVNDIFRGMQLIIIHLE